MTTELKLRKGTTAQHSTFTGAVAEVTVDTDKDTVVVHDGSTPGGHPVAKESRQITATGGLTGGGSLANDRSIAIADGGVSTAKIADDAVTTAKIADAQVTGAKLASGAAAANIGNYVSAVNGQTGNVTVALPSPATATPLVNSGSGAVGTSNSFAREDHVHPIQPSDGVTSVLGATGTVSSGGITAGTTYTVWTSYARGSATPQLESQTATYPDWRNASNDAQLFYSDTAGQYLWANIFQTTPNQAAWVAFNAGTYRLLFTQISNSSLVTNTIRVLVNGTQVYSISGANTTANRSVDITVAPFDVIVLQIVRATGASGTAICQNIRFQTANGGLIMSRTGA